MANEKYIPPVIATPIDNAHDNPAPSAPIFYDDDDDDYVDDSAFVAGKENKSIDFSKVPPEIIDTVNEGRKILKKLDMTQVQAKVCAILDISCSMENPNGFITSGALQKLFNQFFSLAILLDDNQEIEVFLLGSEAKTYPVTTVTKDNYEDFVNHICFQQGLARETAYHKPIEQVLNHYYPEHKKNQWKYEAPVFCTFLTDGAPNPSKSGRLAKGLIAEAADSGKSIFFKFLALHGQNTNFKLLQEIDDDPSRSFDNCDFVDVFEPQSLTMKDVINEFRGFVLDAKKLGYLDSDYDIPAKYLTSEDRVSSRGSSNSFCSTCCHFLLDLLCKLAVVAGTCGIIIGLAALSVGSAATFAPAACVAGGAVIAAIGFFNMPKQDNHAQQPVVAYPITCNG